MDHQLTLRLKKWLEAKEHTEREDINAGALMLLQLNRNQAMYNTIVRNPNRYVAKIAYELSKFLPSRLQNLTMDDVVKMEEVVLPPIQTAVEAELEDAVKADVLPLRGGKRADHDTLPENIQDIWAQNAERWKKIKEEYNTCLSLDAPCDRYEHVTILKEQWYKYKEEFNRYDEYKAPEAEEGEDNGKTATVDPLKLAEDIANAQKYVSKYAKPLIEARTKAMSDDATEKQITTYEEKRRTMQEKVMLLVDNGKTLTDAMLAKLAEGGVEVKPEHVFDPDTDSIG